MKRKMIILSLCILFAAIGLQSCEKEAISVNNFSSSQDTLRVEMSKIKGDGLFGLGVGYPSFRDTSAVFEKPVIYPSGIDSLQRTSLLVDYRAKDNKTFVEIVKGYKGGKPVFVVDQNNNKDFTDDTIRELKEVVWKEEPNLIKTNYLISNGTEMVQDSSWLQIARSPGGSVLLGKNEHLLGEIKIDGKPYSFGVVDPWNGMGFNYELFLNAAVISVEGKQIDSIAPRNILRLGEVLDFNGKYYKFQGTSSRGDVAILVKDQPIAEKTGTQLGMKAPSYSVVSTAGEKLTNEQFQDKVTLIANSCGCGGDVESTKAVSEIKNEFGDAIYVLQMDSGIKEKLNTYQIDSEVKENKVFYETYRKQYCSRLVYVIGTDGRIVDKFNIKNWKKALPLSIQGSKI